MAVIGWLSLLVGPRPAGLAAIEMVGLASFAGGVAATARLVRAMPDDVRGPLRAELRRLRRFLAWPAVGAPAAVLLCAAGLALDERGGAGAGETGRAMLAAGIVGVPLTLVVVPVLLAWWRRRR